MNLAALSAIRAIVATHATYNRDHLLTQLDAAIEDARKHETHSQAEVTTVALGGSDGQNPQQMG